ncbi:MAG: two-component regulator propeller domain-containing protein [Gammaproteobacteria bacterium]|nr:two-component regulator propeller domain-containing protein [Gammaproteobacteria bacterium]
MKLDLKGLLILMVVFAVTVVGAYILGMSQATKEGVVATQTTSANAKNSLQNSQLPSTHPNINTSQLPANVAGAFQNNKQLHKKFSHFRVGNRNVKGMLADGDLVWVGTSGGVIRYEIKTDNYKLYDVASGSLLSNGVFHLSKIDGNIFVGTYGGGLSVYNPESDSWKNFNIPDGLADQFVYDVQKVANGDIWIATWSGANRIIGGDLNNPDKWETYNVENTQGGLPNDWVYGLEEGKNGDMWFATEKGLARFSNGQWQNWQHEDGLGEDFEAVKDDIKFSHDPGDASKHHARQKQEQGLSKVNVAYNPNYIVSLKVDDQGIVWAGTWGAGLARFDGKQWTNYSTKDGLPSNHVFMLYKDDNGKIWAGTSHGLAKILGNGKFEVITRRDGLFADNVFSMANASDGTFWIGSFGGVARLKDI